MKKIYLAILVAIFSCSIVTAQAEYRPFVEEGKTWHMKSIAPDGFGDEYSFNYDYFIEGDTLIAGSACKKAYSRNEGNNGGIKYLMALYETGNKVYFIPPESEEKFILYDFTQTQGGSVIIAEMVKNNPISITINILEDKSVTIEGAARRALRVRRAMVGEEEFNAGWWLEGIGSELGPFNTWLFNASGNLSFLLDCELNGKTIYKNEDLLLLENEPTNGDMNGDGIIDVEDVNALINIILKL